MGMSVLILRAEESPRALPAARSLHCNFLCRSSLSAEEHPLSPEYLPALINLRRRRSSVLSVRMATERQMKANCAKGAKSTGRVVTERSVPKNHCETTPVID